MKNIYMGLLLFLTACSSNSRYSVQVVTQQQEDRAQIEQMPTQFSMGIDEDNAAWMRTQLFFEQYLSGDGIKRKQDQYIATTSGKYIYEVRRRVHRTSSEYSVICKVNSPEATSEKAEINAKNVSRFIRTGLLEMVLLDK